MSEVIKLAEAVSSELKEYNAEVVFFPEVELRELEGMRVVVAPAGLHYKTVSRSAHEELPKIQIGELKRCTNDNLPNMLRFIEELGLHFLNRKFGTATCISVAFNPLYSPEHLREHGQFTSVIELTFKEICQR